VAAALLLAAGAGLGTLGWSRATSFNWNTVKPLCLLAGEPTRCLASPVAVSVAAALERAPAEARRAELVGLSLGVDDALRQPLDAPPSTPPRCAGRHRRHIRARARAEAGARRATQRPDPPGSCGQIAGA
jgi:hypothetical protein